jgi:hypothetical protein
MNFKFSSFCDYLIVLFLIVFSSCEGRKNNSLSFINSGNNGINEEISINKIEGEKMLLEQDIISAKQIKIFNQKLFVKTKKKDGFIKQFDLEGRFISSYFHMGSGPGEVLNISSFGFNFNKDNSYIYGNDMIQNKMVYFTLDDSLDVQFETLLFSAIPISKELILGVPIESDNMFGYYNFSGKPIKSFGAFPNSEITDMNYILSQAFVGTYDYNFEKNVFVAALLYTDYIMIFPEIGKDENSIEIRGPLFYDPIYSVTNLHDNPMFTQNKNSRISYVDVVLTENEIIGLFSGYSRGEMAGMPIYGDKLFIFNYEGKIMKAYEISEKLSSITYDSVNKVLYGLDNISSGDEQLYKYNIN